MQRLLNPQLLLELKTSYEFSEVLLCLGLYYTVLSCYIVLKVHVRNELREMFPNREIVWRVIAKIRGHNETIDDSQNIAVSLPN